MIYIISLDGRSWRSTNGAMDVDPDYPNTHLFATCPESNPLIELVDGIYHYNGISMEVECDHDWHLVKDWEGNPDIPNGTRDVSYWVCAKCYDETPERPEGWDPEFNEPYE